MEAFINERTEATSHFVASIVIGILTPDAGGERHFY